MKKLLLILMLFLSLGCYSQSNDISKQYEWPYTYVEFGLGGMIPTDDSNSYTGVQIEAGKFFNPFMGVGIEFQTGAESRYYDHLSYVGLNTRYRLNPVYDPMKTIRWELTAGLGYGWYSYENEYRYDYWSYNYYQYRTTFSYIVPKVGLNAYMEIYDNLHMGLGTDFGWYISTDKENSTNVGVVNVFAKLRYNF